jgi:thiol-disulfide isomerase/thioredoxin
MPLTRRTFTSLAAIATRLFAKPQAAPELTGGPWINTPSNQPVKLADRRGMVTIVHFWAFACGNCRANMPSYNRWYDEFAPKGVTVIGVHTPELERERDPKFVAEHTTKYGVRYPVLLDNNMENWRRWKQQYWPAVYIIDQQGLVRNSWIGELEYDGQRGESKLAQAIRNLLAA